MQVEILGLDKLNKSEQNTVAKTIKSILDGADLKDYSININLVDDEAMEDLHFRFKKKKKTTDVLSFPLPEMERQFALYQRYFGRCGDFGEQSSRAGARVWPQFAGGNRCANCARSLSLVGLRPRSFRR